MSSADLGVLLVVIILGISAAAAAFAFFDDEGFFKESRELDRDYDEDDVQ
jgi:hypothetical protein